MSIQLACVFESGREETIRDYDDLSEAIEDALTLADKHSNDSGDGAGPPKFLRVYWSDKIKFSIAIIRGGLRNAKSISEKVGQG